MFPPEEGRAPWSGSPEVLEEDEAELELQKQLEKGRRLRQLQQLRDSGEKVGGLLRRGWALGPSVTGVSAVACPEEHVLPRHCRQHPHFNLHPLFCFIWCYW